VKAALSKTLIKSIITIVKAGVTTQIQSDPDFIIEYAADQTPAIEISDSDNSGRV